MLNSKTFTTFPQDSHSDFGEIRSDLKLAYFDRTSYISVLDPLDKRVVLFLRPRRFGKSLTLSMLKHFHGVEYLAEFVQISKQNLSWH